MKKNKISKNWINKQRRDIYVRQSKVEGYRSRAVYKLQEIDKKFNILKNGISLILVQHQEVGLNMLKKKLKMEKFYP